MSLQLLREFARLSLPFRPKDLVDDLCRLGCASVRALIELARQTLSFVYCAS
jgi:hypothetical protein